MKNSTIWCNECIFDFIPIILIFLYATHNYEMIQMSNTVLGKLLVICLIMYYANENVIYGIFVCVLVILYYQTDYVEGMCNGLFEKDKLAREGMTDEMTQDNNETTEHIETDHIDNDHNEHNDDDNDLTNSQSVFNEPTNGIVEQSNKTPSVGSNSIMSDMIIKNVRNLLKQIDDMSETQRPKVLEKIAELTEDLNEYISSTTETFGGYFGDYSSIGDVGNNRTAFKQLFANSQFSEWTYKGF
jgi:hypothetical protein